MNLLATLLHYANASPPMYRQEFYALKMRLLEKHARRDGQDIQRIDHECYGRRNFVGDWEGCPGKHCLKCGGTGIYSTRYWRLDRWEWAGYIFHAPAWEIVREKPTPEQVTILGRIEHADYGRASHEAALWLFLLCGEWRLLWRSLQSSCCCGWYWWPLLNVQRVVMEASMFLSWKKCWCGKWFPTWGSGWQICPACRKPRETEIPF